MKLSFSFPCSKDVRLPVQLQRAMAAEAEAAREARAKVRCPSVKMTWCKCDPNVFFVGDCCIQLFYDLILICIPCKQKSPLLVETLKKIG